MSGNASSGTASDLERARERLDEARRAVERHGESQLRAVAEAYDDATDLLDRYADSATGTGDFEAYVEFQDAFVSLVESLPEELPERQAFEEANERLDRRRLREADFQYARETLESARELAALLDEREAARERREEARRAARRRLNDVEDEIADLERLQRLGEADLSASVDPIRDPISAYDEAVSAAFERFRREESAREVLALVSAADSYPLVGFPPPPSPLRSYLDDADVGTEPIPTLLEYAGYSASKLDHYVDDTGRFRQHVATNETYLSRLDAEPLTVGWPPPPRERLRHRAAELVAVVGRFADERVVAAAREVRDVTREPSYERLRRTAVARAELTDDQQRRLADGDVADELDSLRGERERLTSVLDAGETAETPGTAE